MPDPAPDAPPPADKPSTRVWTALAFDFGRRRIGLAAGDSLTRGARPAGAVRGPDAGMDWPAIERQMRELQPAHLVVGLPCNADGTHGALAAAAQSFARELQRRFKLPADMVDERWSSLEAAQRLKSARQTGARRRRVRREDVDAAAACVILEQWFNQTQA
jgi:putative Holliday junction resolvase